MKIFRWKAVIPMGLFAALVVVLWILFIDRIVKRVVEIVGTEVVGAKVELASARLRLRQADLVLEGLRVTDPYHPMKNLVEIPQIVADLDGRALLEAKVVVETLGVRGVRFGTARKESGAIAKPSPSSGIVTRRLLDWANGIHIPPLDFKGLAGTVVRVDAISADSLKTLKEVRAAQAMTDSLRTALQATLRGLDPQPLIDSARALSNQIGQTRLNPVQIAAQASAVRTMVGRIDDMKSRLDAAKGSVEAGVARLHSQATAIDEARQADYRYARGLLNLPSLGGPDISMGLFGQELTERLKPLLYWLNLADEHIPPGLDPRRKPGPKRARLAGTTFTFPKEHTYPAFLLQRGDADLVIGGRTVAAGSYRATITGATTEPAIYGRPMYFSASRSSVVGPHEMRAGGMMDRASGTARDSVAAYVPGVAIDAIRIPAAHASLDLGDATNIELMFSRHGPDIAGFYRMTADSVRWRRDAGTAPADSAPRIGTTAWGEALLWRSLSSVPNVMMEARVSGALRSPHIEVSSNVGEAVAHNLIQALGSEVRKAEADVRARVDALVQAQVSAARQRLTAVETEVAGKVGLQRQQLDQLEAELKEKLSRVVPGVQLPNIPGIRRP